MTGSRIARREGEPLLADRNRNQDQGSSSASASSSIHSSEGEEGGIEHTRPTGSWNPIKRLDMVPAARDRLAAWMVLIGGLAFLIGTWYLVLTQDLRALGYFAPHPILNSLSIISIILGIIPLQPPPPTLKTRSERFKTHQGLILGLALPVLALGTASMWWNKHVHGAVHFTTWHSWFGLACVGWILSQSLLGFLSVHATSLFGGPDKAKLVYKYHRLSGYVLITLLGVTAHMGGAQSTWALSLKGMRWTRVVAFWTGLPVLILGALIRLRTSKMQFRSKSASR